MRTLELNASIDRDHARSGEHSRQHQYPGRKSLGASHGQSEHGAFLHGCADVIDGIAVTVYGERPLVDRIFEERMPVLGCDLGELIQDLTVCPQPFKLGDTIAAGDELSA